MRTTVGAKRILIYGDSLTYSRIPGVFVRFDEQSRWPCLAQRHLGARYEIIEEGLRARTLKGENPFAADRNGYKQFGPILASHLPLDFVVLFLGTNDACERTQKTPQIIADDLRSYFPLLQQWCRRQHMPLPKVLVMAPPIVNERNLQGKFYVGAEAVTRQLPKLYEAVAREHDALFLDTSSLIQPSPKDGVHLDTEAHKLLGNSFASFVKASQPQLYTLKP